MHNERLDRLLEHMRLGKLSVKAFRMDVWRGIRDGVVAGCMGGECVRLWPEHFRFVRSEMTRDWMPVLRGSEQAGAVRGIGLFFGLGYEETLALFTQSFLKTGLWQRWEGWGLKAGSTRAEVRANLERFLKWKKWEEANWIFTPGGQRWYEVLQQVREVSTRGVVRV